MERDVIKFIRQKDYIFKGDIGQGGTGKTVLLFDETINEEFICKKYSPFQKEINEEFYGNFVEEIKILHQLYHKNIVRVYNYYLYPEQKTGFILMEFIKGQNIKEFLRSNPHLLNDIFIQTISGFKYLEERKILHRDIRPDNILVSDDNIVKIIDFGFGKNIIYDEDCDKSISLNWRYKIPSEFINHIYDFRTEVYFIGKLFEEINDENNIKGFSYSNILSEMTKEDYEQRIPSFQKIERMILSGEFNEIGFTEEEKYIYRSFAVSLTSIISKIEENVEYTSDIESIIMGLEEVYRNSVLENIIQRPVVISRCFIKGNYYTYRNQRAIAINIVNDFIILLKSYSINKQKIILNNLWQRLDAIERYSIAPDDMPF